MVENCDQAWITKKINEYYRMENNYTGDKFGKGDKFDYQENEYVVSEMNDWLSMFLYIYFF